MKTSDEVAQLLGLSVGTLSNWRNQGRGPEFIKLGGAVRYSDEAIEAFINESKRRSTRGKP